MRIRVLAMKHRTSKLLLLSLLVLDSARADQAGRTPGAGARPAVQEAPPSSVTQAGSRPSTTGPTQHFTGAVRIDPLFQPREPSRVSGASVKFEPGAHTAWHTHPFGQTLIVTAGVGRVQLWGGSVEEIRPGDVVWIPPGRKHWHGASPGTAMTHIAIVEQLDGKVVDWMEKVSDDQYGR